MSPPLGTAARIRAIIPGAKVQYLDALQVMTVELPYPAGAGKVRSLLTASGQVADVQLGAESFALVRPAGLELLRLVRGRHLPVTDSVAAFLRERIAS